MTLARIRTDQPESVSALSEQLRAAGYDVECVSTAEQCTTEAEVEIRASHLALEDAMNAADSAAANGVPVYIAPATLQWEIEEEPRVAAPPVAAPRESAETQSRYAESLRLEPDPAEAVPKFIFTAGERLHGWRSSVSRGLSRWRENLGAILAERREQSAELRLQRQQEQAERAEQQRIAAEHADVQRLERERVERERQSELLVQEQARRAREAQEHARQAQEREAQRLESLRMEEAGRLEQEGRRAEEARAEAARLAEQARLADQARLAQQELLRKRQAEEEAVRRREQEAARLRNLDTTPVVPEPKPVPSHSSAFTREVPVPPQAERVFAAASAPSSEPARPAVLFTKRARGQRQRAFQQGAAVAAVVSLFIIMVIALAANRRPANPLGKAGVSTSTQQVTPFGAATVPAPRASAPSPAPPKRIVPARRAVQPVPSKRASRPQNRASRRSRNSNDEVVVRRFGSSPPKSTRQNRNGVKVISDLN